MKLMNEIKGELNKWRHSVLIDRKCPSVEMTVLPKIIYRFT